MENVTSGTISNVAVLTPCNVLAVTSEVKDRKGKMNSICLVYFYLFIFLIKRHFILLNNVEES